MPRKAIVRAMIDSHCHLTRVVAEAEGARPAESDRAQVVTGALADLAAVVSIGTGVEDCRATLELAAAHDRVYAAVGIHPNSASEAREPANRDAIERMAATAKVVAIGETGFDDHWRDETFASQHAAFEWHADLARRLEKPLVLHVRDRQGGSDASTNAASAITAAGHRLGMLHCFNGDSRLYEAALDLGWYVSFAGNLTYKSAGLIREVAEVAPLDRLLVETDSPYLAPVPHRGTRNTPGNVRLVAATLAGMRGLEPRELETHLDANATRLFGLGIRP